MTSSTASLNAISARFSRGSRRTFLGVLFIFHRSARLAPHSSQHPLYEGCALSQMRLPRALLLNYQTDTRNRQGTILSQEVPDRAAEPATDDQFGHIVPALQHSVFNPRQRHIDTPHPQEENMHLVS